MLCCIAALPQAMRKCDRSGFRRVDRHSNVCEHVNPPRGFEVSVPVTLLAASVVGARTHQDRQKIPCCRCGVCAGIMATDGAPPFESRAVDYFLVFAYNPADPAPAPTLVDQYPTKELPDFPVDSLWANFALPYVQMDSAPVIGSEPYSFVLTNPSGNYSYGTCVNVTGEGNVIKVLCVLSHHEFLIPLCESFLAQLTSIMTFRVLPVPIERIIQTFVSDTPVPGPGEKLLVGFGKATEEDTKYHALKPLAYDRVSMMGLPPSSDKNFEVLFGGVNFDNILLLVNVLLLEGKLIIHSRHMERIVPTAEALLTLLYPFTWAGVYVPLMPGGAKYLEMLNEGIPVPFVVGMHSVAYASLLASGSATFGAHVLHIDENRIECPEEGVQAFLPTSYWMQTKKNWAGIIPSELMVKTCQLRHGHLSSKDLYLPDDCCVGNFDSWTRIAGQSQTPTFSPKSARRPSRAKSLWGKVAKLAVAQPSENAVLERSRRLSQLHSSVLPDPNKVVNTDALKRALSQALGIMICKVDPSSTAAAAVSPTNAASPTTWVDYARCVMLELFLKLFLNYDWFYQHVDKTTTDGETIGFDRDRFLETVPDAHRSFFHAFLDTNAWHVFLANMDPVFLHAVERFKDHNNFYGVSCLPRVGPHPRIRVIDTPEWWRPFIRPEESSRHPVVRGGVPTAADLPSRSFVYSRGVFPTLDRSLYARRSKTPRVLRRYDERTQTCRRPSMLAVAQTVRLLMKTRKAFILPPEPAFVAPDPEEEYAASPLVPVPVEPSARQHQFMRRADLKSAVKMMMVTSGFQTSAKTRVGSPSDALSVSMDEDPVRNLVDELYRVRNPVV